MERYVNSELDTFPGQFLQLALDGREYRPVVFHMTVDFPTHPIPGQEIKPHTHLYSYHFILYTQGKSRTFASSEEIDVFPGRLLITPPSLPHVFRQLEGETTISHEITFSFRDRQGKGIDIPFQRILTMLYGKAPSGIGCNHAFRLRGGDTARLDQLFRQLLDKLKSLEPFAKVAAVETFNTILLTLLNCLGDGKNIQEDGIRAVRDYMRLNFASPLTVDELAARAGFSRAHFIRKFKVQFGCPPIDYLRRLRINAACNMLRATAFSCSEIASETGFENVYFFSKTFKKLQGVTPTRYRNQPVNQNSAL